MDPEKPVDMPEVQSLTEDKDKPDLENRTHDEGFEMITDDDVQPSTESLVKDATSANNKHIDLAIQEISKKYDVDERVIEEESATSQSEEGEEYSSEGNGNINLTEAELAVLKLVELRFQLHEWMEMRELTIAKLREIADYIDVVSHRTGIAKVASSGTGVLAGGLTIAGGILSIVTAGAALPVLLTGTALGLTAGVTGGAAAITEKVIKSRQMAEAEQAIEKDQEASKHLEETVNTLRQSEVIKKEIKRQAMMSGAGAAANSAQLAQLVAGSAGGIGKLGAEALAKVFGEDLGKEVSKVFLHASGRILSGTVTVVLGGVTMLYDIYKLNSELQEMAKLGAVSEIRTIASQLETSLRQLCGEEVDEEIEKEDSLSSE